jgi:hypothetical protein
MLNLLKFLLHLFSGEIFTVSPFFQQMDDYLHCSLGADGWLRYDRLHHPGFTTLLRDALRYFDYTMSPSYCSRRYHEFGRGRCEVQVNIPPHPSQLSWMAWSATARGDDVDDSLERAA